MKSRQIKMEPKEKWKKKTNIPPSAAVRHNDVVCAQRLFLVLVSSLRAWRGVAGFQRNRLPPRLPPVPSVLC